MAKGDEAFRAAPGSRKARDLGCVCTGESERVDDSIVYDVDKDCPAHGEEAFKRWRRNRKEEQAKTHGVGWPD